MSTSLKLIPFKNGFLKSSDINIDGQPCMTAMIGGTKGENVTLEVQNIDQKRSHSEKSSWATWAIQD